jgi:hypothetical protein
VTFGTHEDRGRSGWGWTSTHTIDGDVIPTWGETKIEFNSGPGRIHGTCARGIGKVTLDFYFGGSIGKSSGSRHATAKTVDAVGENCTVNFRKGQGRIVGNVRGGDVTFGEGKDDSASSQHTIEGDVLPGDSGTEIFFYSGEGVITGKLHSGRAKVYFRHGGSIAEPQRVYYKPDREVNFPEGPASIPGDMPGPGVSIITINRTIPASHTSIKWRFPW